MERVLASSQLPDALHSISSILTKETDGQCEKLRREDGPEVTVSSRLPRGDSVIPHLKPNQAHKNKTNATMSKREKQERERERE